VPSGTVTWMKALSIARSGPVRLCVPVTSDTVRNGSPDRADARPEWRIVKKLRGDNGVACGQEFLAWCSVVLARWFLARSARLGHRPARPPAHPSPSVAPG